MSCGACEKHKKERELLEAQKNSVEVPMQAKRYSKRKLKRIKKAVTKG